MASSFMLPAQLACAVSAVPDAPPFAASSAKELEPVAFCSPPRQSFQLLLHEHASESDGDTVFKDKFQLPPRRAPSGTRQQPPSRDRTSNVTKASNSMPIVTRSSGRYASSSSIKLNKSSQPQKKRPKRKASYLARKEEKEELLKHLDELQSQLNTLKYQAVVHSNFRPQTQARAHLTKSILTDAIQKHQLAVAGLQAMLSKYSSLQEHSPIETTIRLGAELGERRAALLQLKDPKILEAKHFIEERSRGLDVTKTYVEEERFETAHGDFCSVQFDIVPIRGAASVKSVFDTMLYYIGNIEIMLSETMGHVTIREDDDNPDKNISHNRLVTSVGNGLQIETNTVLFSELTETTDGGAIGVIVGDFIDDDDLYPYRPHERIRRDVSMMLTASSYIEKAAPSRLGDNGNGSESDGGNSERQADDELIVVLKRWTLGKLHKPELPVPGTVLQDIRDIYAKWSEETIKSVRQNSLNAAPPAPMLPLTNSSAVDIVL